VEPKALTDTSTSAYYDADFSHEGGFYLLSYSGPNIPWQKVIHTNSTGETLDDSVYFNTNVASIRASGYVLTDNVNLNKTFNEFESPIIKYSEIDSDGYSTRYISLARVYSFL
jgi:dipeptidyl aminopeptidase